MDSLPTPAKVAGLPIYTQARIDLVLLNYNFRSEVLRLRSKYGLPSNPTIDLTPGSEGDKLIQAEVALLMAQFNPSLPEPWDGLIYDYLVYDAVHPFPAIWDESFGAIDNIDTFRNKVAETMSKIGWGPQDISIQISNDPPKLTVEIWRNLPGKDWAALSKRLKGLMNDLPEPVTTDSISIRALSRVANMYREDAGTTARIAAAKLQEEGLGIYEESSIRQLHKRAKALGL